MWPSAEIMHTSLAAWQGGQREQAFVLWKSALIESMYLGGSPGNFQQISTYDAARGEAYRDFADPIAMTARSMIEGLFGILPDLLENEIVIKPGFPASWNHASLQTPDVHFRFKRIANTDEYTIKQVLTKTGKLVLQLNAFTDQVSSVTVNGKKLTWKNIDSVVGTPMISIDCGLASNYVVKITWLGKTFPRNSPSKKLIAGGALDLDFGSAVINKVYDPQHAFSELEQGARQLKAVLSTQTGYKTAFVQLKQGNLKWWQPVSLQLVQAVDIFRVETGNSNDLTLGIRNNSVVLLSRKLQVNEGQDVFAVDVRILAGETKSVTIPAAYLHPGSNRVTFNSTASGKP